MEQLEKQSKKIIDYFIDECNKDPYGLQPEFFFRRVRNSIRNNGVAITASLYELDEEILEEIKENK